MQGKDKKKSGPEFYVDTNSNTTTGQSNSRNASSASSCKLINSIKEKRKKSQAQQSFNFIPEKSSNDNTVCDKKTSQCRIYKKKLNEEGNKEEINVKVGNSNIGFKDTISPTKDCCCKDTDSTEIQQDSLNSIVPCSSFNYDNTKLPQSGTIIHLSKVRPSFEDNDTFPSNTICSNMKKGNYYKNDNRDDVGKDEHNVCHSIDDSRWLPKSIYTDRVTCGRSSKECFADECKYRNKIFQDLVNHIQKKRMGYKFLQQYPENSQKEHIVSHWSTCNSVKEEDENYCKDIDRVQKDISESVCNGETCSEKITLSRTSCRKLDKSTAVYETWFDAPGERFGKTRTCKGTFENTVQRSKDTTTRGTRFRNAKELPKVTRVCKEFVTEEPPKDITVCKTEFGEPKGPPEEVIVYKTALPDSKETPEETISKEIPDSNFANQDVKSISLNTKDNNLVGEGTSSSNLNDQEKNTETKKVKLNNINDITLNNFTKQQSVNYVKQNKEVKVTVNDPSKNSHQIPVKSIRDSKLLSKNIYPTTKYLPPQLYDRSNFVYTNTNVKRTSNTFVNQRRTESLNQSKNHSQQQSNDITQELILNKNNQLKEKMQKKEGEKEEAGRDILNEIKTIDDKPKESLLQQPLKKLLDIIKRGKIFITDKIEMGKIEEKKTVEKKDIEKSEIAFEINNEINDIKDQLADITEESIKLSETESINRGKI
ncbi:hypothetical protein P5V15_006680 [Pogonomyrmex californicus]